MQYSNILLNQLSELFPASDKNSIHYIADVLLSQSNNPNLTSARSSPITSANTLLPAYPSLNFSTYQPQYSQAVFPGEMPTTCSFGTPAWGVNSNSSTISTSPSVESLIGEKKDIFDVDESMFDFGDAFEYNELSGKLSNDDMTPEQPERLLKGSKKINKTKSQSKAFPEKERKQRATSRKGLWKPEEDAMLRELVQTHGPKWAMIGSIIGNKSGKQVRDRYNNISRSDINSSEWTEEEDALFISLLEKYGNKWCTIAAEMPGRTESQVKNKFYCLKKNKRSRNQRKIALKEAIENVQQKRNTNCQSSESSFEDLSKQEAELDCPSVQQSCDASLYSDIDCFFQFTADTQNNEPQRNFSTIFKFENCRENMWQETNYGL